MTLKQCLAVFPVLATIIMPVVFQRQMDAHFKRLQDNVSVVNLEEYPTIVWENVIFDGTIELDVPSSRHVLIKDCTFRLDTETEMPVVLTIKEEE